MVSWSWRHMELLLGDDLWSGWQRGGATAWDPSTSSWPWLYCTPPFWGCGLNSMSPFFFPASLVLVLSFCLCFAPCCFLPLVLLVCCWSCCALFSVLFCLLVSPFPCFCCWGACFPVLPSVCLVLFVFPFSFSCFVFVFFVCPSHHQAELINKGIMVCNDLCDLVAGFFSGGRVELGSACALDVFTLM